MDLHIPETLAAFLDGATPFLSRHEAEHGLMLGVAASTAVPVPGAYWASVRRGDEVVAAALRTDYRLILSREAAPGAMTLLAADALRPEPGGGPEPATKAVLGPSASVAAFVAASGRTWRDGMGQRIYELRAVVPARSVVGEHRRARPDDRTRLVQWRCAFTLEAVGETLPSDAAEAAVDLLIARGALHVWDVGGRPVASAAAVQPTPHGIRISAVYTPPAWRGRGYASALVAALSQWQLDAGRTFVFLHTDLANPTSNHIYQRVGYVPVGDVQMLWLEPAG